MTYADEILPAKFLEMLGRYVANVAYLERAIWKFILAAEGIEDIDTDERLYRALTVRKMTAGNLLTELEKTLPHLSEKMRTDLSEIILHMKTFLDNRHMAVHGAWYTDGENFRVEYFKNEGSRRQPQWAAYSKTIKWNEIVESVDDVSRLAFIFDRFSIEIVRSRREA